MIYCPDCGTANRDGSRFCNECGQSLAARTGVKCPVCGTLNAVQSVFCSKCGGRLLDRPAAASSPAAAPIKGLSLPTKPAFGEAAPEPELAAEPVEGEEEIPAWLRELGATLAADNIPGGEPPGPEQEEMPPWLRDLRASLPEEGEAEAAPPAEPSPQPPATGPVAPEEPAEQVPDWLAELRPSAAPPAAPAVGETEPGEAPDWLAELRPSAPLPPEAPPTETVPDWLFELRTTTAEPPAATAAEAPAEAELPDWLAELQRGSGAPAAPAEEVPDWLAGQRATPGAAEPPVTAPTEAAAEAELPDWLARLQSGAGAPAAPVSAPEPEPAQEVPDWLAALRSQPDETKAAAEEAAEEELPDWLTALQPSAPIPEPEPEPGPAEQVPDWLAGLRAEPDAAIPPAEAAAEAELPDWLAELQRGGGAPAAPATEPAQAPPEEVPDWLAGLRAEPAVAEPPVTAPTQAAAEAELPDWLAELRPGGGAPAAPTAGAAIEPQPAAELPDWLAELQPAPGEAEGPEIVPGAELPDWLADLQAGAGPPEAPSPAAAAGEQPDWLADLRQTAAAAPEAPAEAGGEAIGPKPPAGEEAFEEAEEEHEELPGWLAELQPAGAGRPAPAGGAPAGGPTVPGWLSDLEATSPEEEPLEAGELPDWLVPSGDLGDRETLAPAEIPAWLLALKPRELKQEGEPEPEELAFEEPVEQTGLLAGIRDVLPVEMIIAQPRAATPSAPEAAIVETPEARLFAEVVALPLLATAKAMPRPTPRLLSRLPWWFAFGLLFAAVALPLLLTESPLARTIEPIPAVAAAYQSVESLPSGAPVLVVFDYDPTTSGEMDVVAEPILRHLMDRQARIIAVSLLPAGPATADSLVARVAAGRSDYQPGGRLYANLGFLPGQATAVRLMGQDLPRALPRDFSGSLLAEVPATSGITSTHSFALVVELAAGADTLRWWIEQAVAPYGVPLLAGVSAVADLVARPYFESESPQLRGVVGGVLGAAGYEVARSGPEALPQPLTARLDALLAGQAVMIVVLFVGNVVYLTRRGMGRK